MGNEIETTALIKIRTGESGKTLYVPSSFQKKVWRFKPWEVRFLDCLNRGMLPDEAEKALSLEAGRSLRLLNSRRAKEYLSERVRERIAAEGFTAEKWVSDGLRVWNGEKTIGREQLAVWQALGERIAPVVKKRDDEEKNNAPVININIGSISEAEKRLKSVVEGELAN